MFRCYSYTIIRERINSCLLKLGMLKLSIKLHPCVVNTVVVWLHILGPYRCTCVALFGSSNLASKKYPLQLIRQNSRNKIWVTHTSRPLFHLCTIPYIYCTLSYCTAGFSLPSFPTIKLVKLTKEPCFLFVRVFNYPTNSSIFFKFDINVASGHLIIPLISYTSGDRGGTVVKVLCYKSEGRWFDPSWCHCHLSLT